MRCCCRARPLACYVYLLFTGGLTEPLSKGRSVVYTMSLRAGLSIWASNPQTYVRELNIQTPNTRKIRAVCSGGGLSGGGLSRGAVQRPQSLGLSPLRGGQPAWRVYAGSDVHRPALTTLASARPVWFHLSDPDSPQTHRQSSRAAEQQSSATVWTGAQKTCWKGMAV